MYSNLEGSIPSDITQLTNLTLLDLQANNLTGEIPNIKILKGSGSSVLRLNGNCLNITDSVAKGINSQNITYSNLGYNCIETEVFKKYPNLINDFKNWDPSKNTYPGVPNCDHCNGCKQHSVPKITSINIKGGSLNIGYIKNKNICNAN